jgi:hypothetical protein
LLLPSFLILSPSRIEHLFVLGLGRMEGSSTKKQRAEKGALGAGGLSSPTIRFDAFLEATVKTSRQTEVSTADQKQLYDDAVSKHPFVDKAEYQMLVTGNAVVRDAKDNIVAIVIRKAYPPEVARDASNVLRTAPSRTSLRAHIFGGEAPLSGIAGYYDYSGSPVDLKCRKTSYTCEVINRWEKVFPLIEYVSAQYRRHLPDRWEAQNAAIPDCVRIHGSPFSTLTINQRFRTARHTDAGDFDEGFGILTVLEGKFEGLHLGIPEFSICIRLEPTDLLLFNTHHWHCNTEVENPTPDWDRLTCVFYYRAALGEARCVKEYQRRLKAAVQEGKPTYGFQSIVAKDNGENLNRPATTYRLPYATPFSFAQMFPLLSAPAHTALRSLHAASSRSLELQRSLFGGVFCDWRRVKAPQGSSTDSGRAEAHNRFLAKLFATEHLISDSQGKGNGKGQPTSKGSMGGGLPLRSADDRLEMFDLMENRSSLAQPKTGGFSSSLETADFAQGTRQHELLNEASLKECLPPALFDMWCQARRTWLDLVKKDWKKLTENMKDRTDFSWNNRGDMNFRFFDLCEVAQQIMLLLLGKEEAKPAEANAFWAVFATHLYHACINELRMPDTAMSMRKLNVKLKDFEFGGTRYFKDMPPEEQARRLLRKKRIEDARRGMLEADGGAAKPSDENWLLNDEFDYQSEERPVSYEALGCASPTDYLNRSPTLMRNKAEFQSAAELPLKLLIIRFTSGVPMTEEDRMKTETELQQQLLALVGNQQLSTNGETPSPASVECSTARSSQSAAREVDVPKSAPPSAPPLPPPKKPAGMDDEEWESMLLLGAVPPQAQLAPPEVENREERKRGRPAAKATTPNVTQPKTTERELICHELRRLLSNLGVQSLISAPSLAASSLLPAMILADGESKGVQVTQVGCTSLSDLQSQLSGTSPFDVILLPFVLCHLPDTDVLNWLQYLRGDHTLSPQGLILATETDLTDREYSLLKPSVARAFDKVRIPAFQYLHWLSNTHFHSGVAVQASGEAKVLFPPPVPIHLRSESTMRKLLESSSNSSSSSSTHSGPLLPPTVLGTYYFDECPLNTIGLLIL